MSEYLHSEGEHCLESVSDSAKLFYNKLNEITLSQIILFNRRRQGEVSKMKVEDIGEKTYNNM